MPSWYEKAKEQRGATSRYHGSLSANIVVPENPDKELEQENAYNSLNESLPTSGFVGDSVVNFNIEKVEPYVKLV